jgi:RNA-binding protein
MAAVPATNPKKKALMPSGELRRKLRGVAHSLDPVVQVGKSGITAALVKQVAHALYDHELIKVKIGSESPETRFEIADRLGAEPGVNVVQILGKVIVLYKRHPEEPIFEGAGLVAPAKKPVKVGKKPAPAKKKPVAAKKFRARKPRS